MIQSVSTPELQTEFLRRIAHKPYFESTLGTHLHLFGNHPASGWAFYLLAGWLPNRCRCVPRVDSK